MPSTGRNGSRFAGGDRNIVIMHSIHLKCVLAVDKCLQNLYLSIDIA